MTPEELNTELGNLDFFVLDQVLKGRIGKDYRVLDTGCGEGRNLFYFLKNGYDVYGIDHNPVAIKMVKMQARTLKAKADTANFQVGELSSLPYEDGFFQAVLSIAVLHFANSKSEFRQMISEILRVLHPEGIFFLKMDTSIGFENRIAPSGDGIYKLLDGSYRYLLSDQDMDWLKEECNLKTMDPERVEIIGKGAAVYLVLRKAN
jgi:SAM-dependent methyltransferase